MQEVIDSIKNFYEHCNLSVSDFEAELQECHKSDLVGFIVNMQCRGAFRGIIHD